MGRFGLTGEQLARQLKFEQQIRDLVWGTGPVREYQASWIPERLFACAEEAQCYDELVSHATRNTILQATTEAVKHARAGASARDAVTCVADRFRLTAEDEVDVERCVVAMTTAVRVRATSGVAIGWVRPRGDGSWEMGHDRWGKADYVYSNREAAVNRVRKADNGGGF